MKLRGELKKELRWWLKVLPSTKNGIKLEFLLKNRGIDGKFDIEVFTDASTSFGVGGYVVGMDDNWFRHKWKPEINTKPDIVFMELLVVCSAVQL